MSRTLAAATGASIPDPDADFSESGSTTGSAHFGPAVIADFLFEKDKIFAYLNLDNEELKLYERYFERFAAELRMPELVIYLQATPEVLRERIAKKAAPGESRISQRIYRRGGARLRTFFLPLLGLQPARREHFGNRLRQSQRRLAATSATHRGAGEGHAIFSAAWRRRLSDAARPRECRHHRRRRGRLRHRLRTLRAYGDVFLLEQLPRLGMATSTRNSGVIHSGIYYPPGSLKARLCVEGNRLTKEFCAAHGVPHRNCGKIVVASHENEVATLEKLAENGRANGVEGLRMVGPSEIREREPHVTGVAALEVPSTASSPPKNW